MDCFLCSIKENEEASFSMVKPSETVKTFDPLPESIFTQPIQLDKSKYMYW